MVVKPVYKSICVYCGSADGLADGYLAAARELGQILADRAIELVYGAGKTGLMGAVADGVLNAGGKVIGVVSENLNQPQLMHTGLTRLEVVADIHQRKARMSQLAEAFIALPGGYGTLDELFETLTWAQIGLHTKPVGLLNINGYFSPLLAMIERARNEKFIYDEHRDLLVSSDRPLDLLDLLENFKSPSGLDRWVNR
ncbi:MAG TPA: TIGR00730 family Rossman fold protein [Bellilinea sp.]